MFDYLLPFTVLWTRPPTAAAAEGDALGDQW